MCGRYKFTLCFNYFWTKSFVFSRKHIFFISFFLTRHFKTTQHHEVLIGTYLLLMGTRWYLQVLRLAHAYGRHWLIMGRKASQPLTVCLAGRVKDSVTSSDEGVLDRQPQLRVSYTRPGAVQQVNSLWGNMNSELSSTLYVLVCFFFYVTPPSTSCLGFIFTKFFMLFFLN